MEAVFLLIGGLLIVALMLQRWFWVLAFFLGGLAAWAAALSSVIYFLPFHAVGFFVLGWVGVGIAGVLAEGH